MREYMEDNVVEEGRSYIGISGVKNDDGLFHLQIKQETENEREPAEFDFTKFHRQEPHSPSPEPVDPSNWPSCYPIPEETEEPAELESNPTPPFRVPLVKQSDNRQPKLKKSRMNFSTAKARLSIMEDIESKVVCWTPTRKGRK